jgi:hypothetical protein
METMSRPAGTFRTAHVFTDDIKPNAPDGDLSLITDPGKQVIVHNDLTVYGNSMLSGILNPATGDSDVVAAKLIQPDNQSDLILRASSVGRIVLNGDMEISGSLTYVDPDSNLLWDNNLIIGELKTVTLGRFPNGSNVDMTGSGLLIRGTDYPQDPRSLSLTWNGGDSNMLDPYWKLNGGDLQISRVIDGVPFAYKFAIDGEGQLIVQRVHEDSTTDDVLVLVPLQGS